MGDLGRRVWAIAAAALLAASCSKVTSGTTPSENGGIPGVLRIVGIGSIDSLNPELSASASSTDIAQFWGAWLFTVNDRGDLEPDLATEIPTYENGGISRDGRTIVYHLRRGVRWQDGAPFDARDVIFTWHVVMNPANNVLTREGYDDITSMTAPDPYTVRVTLRTPYAPAIATFFGPSLQPFVILPQHLLAGLPDINHAAYNNKPIGTGPFEVVEYDPGTKVVLKPNPGYWRAAPHLSEVDFPLVGDPNTRVVMMRTGEADLYYDPGEAEVNQLADIPGVHVNSLTFNEFWYITYNETHPPLDDIRVRRAIAMAVDRDYIARVALQGHVSPAETDQPAFSWAFDPNAHEPPFDVAAAGRQLDAAGWTLGPGGIRTKNGKQLSLVLVSGSAWGDAHRFAPIFEAEMTKLGIGVTIKYFPTSVLEAAKGAGGIINSGRFDIAFSGWINGVDPDESTLWMCDQAPPAGWNQSFSCDPRIDAQERIALASYDRNVRRAAYWKIQKLLAQDLPAVIFYYSKRDDALRDGFEGYRPAPAVTEFWNTWQWEMR
jgi:peptide/nickel transport system substrate-binding protein